MAGPFGEWPARGLGSGVGCHDCADPTVGGPCAGGRSRRSGDCARALRNRAPTSYAAGMTSQSQAPTTPVTAIGGWVLDWGDAVYVVVVEGVRRAETLSPARGLGPGGGPRASLRDNP